MKTLFINACVRENSRTLKIAGKYLEKLGGSFVEVNLDTEKIAPLDSKSLAKRDELIANEKWDDPMLKYAKQFAEADEIVVAAPYWDLGFPALLKIYIEAITVTGVTFHYIDGIPHGLCKAKRLTYITTSGGPIFADFGFSYVKTMAESFFGVGTVNCIKAENLDIIGADVEGLVNRAIETIDEII